MDIDHKRVQELVEHLAESLNVEAKNWISPDDSEGSAKIVRAVFALRNRNGGYLAIGFNNNTLQPEINGRPSDERGAFHVDKVQGLISRYSSELFEIGVAFPQLDGRKYPVICVPVGVQAPVAVKSDLSDGTGKNLIRVGDVYFRTLNANGTPSSAVARAQDWRDIVQICFDNREGDIGAFLRRQLAGRDIANLAAALKMLGVAEGKAEGVSTAQAEGRAVKTPAEIGPSLRDRTLSFLTTGNDRFKRAISARNLKSDEKSVVETGSWEVALVIDPPSGETLPDQTFYSKVASSNPQLSGWPVWLDSRGFSDESARPIVTDNAWEALIVSLEGWSRHVDFYRLNPQGEFYLWRNLEDDVYEKIKPSMYLDPIIVLLRVAEAIAVGMAIAKSITQAERAESTRLSFAFRWKKLKGRKLHPWANPFVTISAFQAAHDDAVTTYVEAPLDTPVSGIPPLVDQATQDLFVLFGGYRLRLQATEDWVQKLLQRKL
jgi:hypothetical protein